MRTPIRKIFDACLGGALAASVLAAAAARAGEPAALPKLAEDLTKLPFEDLLKVEVTSVSRREEPAGSAAAALYVLTGEELRRSGVRTIAEALRLVPGLEVARNTATFYAISARGFNSVDADKLQVLVDGRSIYTPLNSSVFWDLLDPYLPDIERIEVIRGPGAALWGSNAVNGVINIVTKRATDTRGASGDVYAGNEDRYGLGARLGLPIGDHGSLRLYSQGYARGSALRADGTDAQDGVRQAHAGFRSDWTLGGAGLLTVSGDGYQGTEKMSTVVNGNPNGPKADMDRSGGNLLARWSCCTEEDGQWWVQATYDGYYIAQPTLATEQRRTVALDFQQQWLLGARHTLIYGLGILDSRDRTGGPPLAVIFDPPSRRLNTYSAFVQDQMRLFDGGTLTLGSKFEHNSFSGFEVQPSVRFGWQASERVFTWAAVSRAVRTPNRIDQDFAIFCPPPNGYPGICGPGVFRAGNPNLDSEKLIAYEWGLRLHSARTLAFDLATYYNHYSELRSTETTPPLGAFGNQLKADSYGAELSVLWQPLPQLKLRPFYTLLVLDARPAPGSTDTTTAANLEGSSPRHQAGLRISYAPAPRWFVTSFLRYVDTLSQIAPPSPASGSTRVPAYLELDLRLSHRFAHGLELWLSGENLLHSRHPEYGSEVSRSELQRAAVLELRWNWQ